ncbi:pyrroline-5-carboxylate reductase [Caldivirga sp. UBA161]|uniref:pyrroline-5-carboxylate reductase n=1 Tax=Caldivirga sp. UBA161 TaxID=1915569 RepID=UPI0025C261B1|nr:pyrroline-5-carboxylate reductase [Caldivirga sp. UBA161]
MYYRVWGGFIAKYAIIGLGKIGTAIAKALIKTGVKACDIAGSVRSEHGLMRAKGELPGIHVALSNEEVVKDAEVIVLAVKPRQVVDVINDVGKLLTEDKLMISVVAGLSTRILGNLTRARVIRGMPNIAILEGSGVTAVSRGPRATDTDVEFTCSLFNAVGKCYIINEEYLNAVTALSGSGPAYVAMIVEALWEAGILVGLPSDLAWSLSIDVIESGARLLNSKKPWEIISDVATPGGVTISGIKFAEERGLKGLLMGMIESAYRRSTDVQKIIEDTIEANLSKLRK